MFQTRKPKEIAEMTVTNPIHHKFRSKLTNSVQRFQYALHWSRNLTSGIAAILRPAEVVTIAAPNRHYKFTKITVLY
jgi:hypothetical protein